MGDASASTCGLCGTPPPPPGAATLRLAAQAAKRAEARGVFGSGVSYQIGGSEYIPGTCWVRLFAWVAGHLEPLASMVEEGSEASLGEDDRIAGLNPAWREFSAGEVCILDYQEPCFRRLTGSMPRGWAHPARGVPSLEPALRAHGEK